MPTPAPSPTVEAVQTELELLWFTDGPDQIAIENLLAIFNQNHPETTVTLTVIPYSDLNELLASRLANNDGPDLARVTEPSRFIEYGLDLQPYLSQPDWAKAFLEQPMKLTTKPDGAVFGIPHDLTLNAPFVNVSLFEQAGIPLPTEACVTWEEWGQLAEQVRDKTGLRFAMAVDRSGHRLDGFIQSYGGGYFGLDGTLRLKSAETIAGLSAFVELHQSEIIPLDVWVGSGSSYVSPDQLFIDNLLPFYLSGNWQVSKFEQAIGDKFAWKTVLNGCKTQYGGMPGGKFIVAFNQTNQPELVVELLEYLGSREAMTQYAQETLFLPTRRDLISEGFEYPIQNETMNTFLQGINLLPETAYADQYNPNFGFVGDAVRDQITKVLAGELTVEEAIETVEATVSIE